MIAGCRCCRQFQWPMLMIRRGPETPRSCGTRLLFPYRPPVGIGAIIGELRKLSALESAPSLRCSCFGGIHPLRATSSLSKSSTPTYHAPSPKGSNCGPMLIGLRGEAFCGKRGLATSCVAGVSPRRTDLTFFIRGQPTLHPLRLSLATIRRQCDLPVAVLRANVGYLPPSSALN